MEQTGNISKMKDASDQRVDPTARQQTRWLKVLSYCVAMLFAACIALTATLIWHIVKSDESIETLKDQQSADKWTPSGDMITNVASDQDDAITRLENSITDLGNRTNTTDKVVVQLTQFLDDSVNRLERSILDLANKTNMIDDNTSGLFLSLGSIERTVNTKVSFMAGFYSNRLVSSGQTVKFNKVLSNTGNGYNGTTGLFTAPGTGTYIFCLKIQNEGTYHKVEVMKNSSPITGLKADAESGTSIHGGDTTVFTIDLSAGDLVYAMVVEGSSNILKDYSMFSGMYIK